MLVHLKPGDKIRADCNMTADDDGNLVFTSVHHWVNVWVLIDDIFEGIWNRCYLGSDCKWFYNSFTVVESGG